MAKYALEGLSNRVLAAEYRTTLPQERLLAAEIQKTRRRLSSGTNVELDQSDGRRDEPQAFRRVLSRLVAEREVIREQEAFC